MTESGYFAGDPFYQKYLGHPGKTLYVLRCLPEELSKPGGLGKWGQQVDRFLAVGCHVTSEKIGTLVGLERFQVATMSHAVKLILDPNILDLL
jgi:hypothetical protein